MPSEGNKTLILAYTSNPTSLYSIPGTENFHLDFAVRVRIYYGIYRLNFRPQTSRVLEIELSKDEILIFFNEV